MNSRVDTVNRVVLTLLGLVLLATGGLGLALSFGALGAAPRLLPAAVRNYPAEQPWFWWAVAGACTIVALFALWWLFAQLHTNRVARLDLTGDDRDGQTLVHAGALTDAVENEATELRGVTSASAHLLDRHGRRLALAVDLADYADIAEVRAGLEDRVVAHARQATDDTSMPVDIELRPAASRRGGRGLL